MEDISHSIIEGKRFIGFIGFGGTGELEVSFSLKKVIVRLDDWIIFKSMVVSGSPIGSIYCTTYIPLIVLAVWGVKNATYHLLGEPETTID